MNVAEWQRIWMRNGLKDMNKPVLTKMMDKLDDNKAVMSAIVFCMAFYVNATSRYISGFAGLRTNPFTMYALYLSTVGLIIAVFRKRGGNSWHTIPFVLYGAAVILVFLSSIISQMRVSTGMTIFLAIKCIPAIVLFFAVHNMNSVHEIKDSELSEKAWVRLLMSARLMFVLEGLQWLIAFTNFEQFDSFHGFANTLIELIGKALLLIGTLILSMPKRVRINTRRFFELSGIFIFTYAMTYALPSLTPLKASMATRLLLASMASVNAAILEYVVTNAIRKRILSKTATRDYLRDYYGLNLYYYQSQVEEIKDLMGQVEEYRKIVPFSHPNEPMTDREIAGLNSSMSDTLSRLDDLTRFRSDFVREEIR